MSTTVVEIETSPGSAPANHLDVELQHGQYVLTLAGEGTSTFIRLAPDQALRLSEALFAWNEREEA